MSKRQMGWGICIAQNENGFVCCSDAGFETDASDYEGYPPSSYEYIYDKVEESHSEIDMARDEIGVDAARAECREAFESALRSWDDLEPSEKWKMHGDYVKDLKERIKGCVLDKTRHKEKVQQIQFFEKKWGPALDKIDTEIQWLAKQLEEKRIEYKKKRQDLTILESELAIITAPLHVKRELQAQLKLELNWAEDNRG